MEWGQNDSSNEEGEWIGLKDNLISKPRKKLVR